MDDVKEKKKGRKPRVASIGGVPIENIGKVGGVPIENIKSISGVDILEDEPGQGHGPKEKDKDKE